MDDNWNPDLYLKFKQQRTMACVDLVHKIQAVNVKTIIDLGCGPGNSTDILKQKFTKADILGIDSSKEMIKKAQNDYPDGQWQVCPLMDFKEFGKYDIVFSNAVLQWLPEHEKVVPYMVKLLKSKGTLAFQVPQNQASGLNRAMFETAELNQFREYVLDVRKMFNYNTGEYYYDLLYNRMKKLVIWETEYYHVLDSHQDLITFYKSTGLKPYLARLPEKELKNEFINTVLEKCKQYYEFRADNKIIFPFKRLFIVGYL